MLLLADAETVAAAQGWYLSAWDLQRFLLDPEVERTQERFDQLYSTTNDMREAFHHAARRSLGVNRGSGPIDLRPRSDRGEKY